MFALVTCVAVVLLGFAALLVLDVYLHWKTQNVAGVNVWGYRGPVVPSKKQPGEVRLAAIGGSTVFGYGLRYDESWPFYLEQRLRRRAPSRPVTVVNLGVPTDSARTFTATLTDYAYLHFDVALFYEGYNDLGLEGPEFHALTNPAVPHFLAWRHQSPVFRWTGYFPIFPLVLHEKAMSMLAGGDLNAAYDRSGKKIVFRPNLATRATAGAMKTAAELSVALEREFGQLSNTTPILSETREENCGRWSAYCGAVAEAVDWALARGKSAYVISQPYLSDLHVDQQRALAMMVARRYPGNARVRYVNLGRVVSIQDKSLVYDGLHLVARGNAMIADALVPLLVDGLR